MSKQYGPYVWPEDTNYYYSLWTFGSFLAILVINHAVAPFFFSTFGKVYQRLSEKEKNEWNCRTGSTIHATFVTLLSLYSLIWDTQQWINPITTVSRPGCIALSISIGYMFADSITMFTFQKGLELFLFCVHHLLVAVCFTFLLVHRIAPIYGIIRLTSEISTPFLNQRWFYRTIGGEEGTIKAAKVTLCFAAMFCLGRYVLPIPYWYIFLQNFNSEPHLYIKDDLPPFTNWFISCPILLDVINIAWGVPVSVVSKKALITLGYISGDALDETAKPVQNGLIGHNGNGVTNQVNGKVSAE